MTLKFTDFWEETKSTVREFQQLLEEPDAFVFNVRKWARHIHPKKTKKKNSMV
jgi:hypothetical protein